MSKFTFSGMEEYERLLSKLYTDTTPMCRNAVYEGAKVVADAVRSSIESLQAKPDLSAIIAYRAQTSGYLVQTQKQGLLDGFGVSPMQNENGYINVKLGFDGYNDIQTHTYPNGQPNALIARSVDGGTSFMKKQPFIRKAVKRSQNKAVEVMQQSIDHDISNTMKG